MSKSTQYSGGAGTTIRDDTAVSRYGLLVPLGGPHGSVRPVIRVTGGQLTPTHMTGSDWFPTSRGGRRAITVNDSMATITLVAFAIVLAAGLGTGILIEDDDADGTAGAPAANFSFQHYEDESALVVTYERGDPVSAGDVALVSGETNVTWATIANESESAEIREGSAIQLSRGSQFGKAVTTGDTLRVVWIGGNETEQLAEWPR